MSGGRVQLTPHAENGLFEIWQTVAAANPAAADDLIRRLMHKLGLAADNPLMGAARPELSESARLLVEGRYLIIYEPSHDGVTAVAVVHGMRDPETWLR